MFSYKTLQGLILLQILNRKKMKDFFQTVFDMTTADLALAVGIVDYTKGDDSIDSVNISETINKVKNIVKMFKKSPLKIRFYRSM